MSKAEVEKQDVVAKLLEALGTVDRPGDFCTSDDLPLTMPGLEVEGLGLVRLPLGETQAKELIQRCRQAPYGKGTETVVDTDVRRVWELDARQFQLTNAKWEDLVASIVRQVQQRLGLDNCKLQAHLYKLLVYEEGSFFLPHRDGEKLDGMVATLVIGLPSIHDGGELIVSHEGQRQEIVFGGAAAGYELSYAAFYADCQHEIRPVRSGYRLCLTYNVTLARSSGQQQVAAPSYGPTAAAISQLLKGWRQCAQPDKLAVLLEHRYTQDGLTFDKLKGIDRAQAEVLFQAAEEADCVAHLALVTLWLSGSAEGGIDEYAHYHWSDDEEADVAGNVNTSGYEMGDIIEQSLSADCWSDRYGNKVNLGSIDLAEDELVAHEALQEGEPTQEEFEGYTGNAGMTLDRWYHRAAVLIWPREKHFAVLCSAGIDASIGGLKPLVKGLQNAKGTERERQLEDCAAFARSIMDAWKPSFSSAFGNTHKTDRDDFAELLCELDEPELLQCFLSQILTKDGNIQVDHSFVTFCQRHGWASFEPQLLAVFEASTLVSLRRNATMLHLLCVAGDNSGERIHLCKSLSRSMVEAVKLLDEQPSGRDSQTREVDRAALLCDLIKATVAVGANEPLERLVEHILASKRYDLTATHLAAIFALEPEFGESVGPAAAISRWIGECRRQLEIRTAQEPIKPVDYQRPSQLPCHCADCQALSKFLADPHQREARFPLAEGRRQHLHQVITANHCDCMHVTQRRGRPYTLVCTKTTASYEAACKTYERDVQNLSRLIAIEKKMGR